MMHARLSLNMPEMRPPSFVCEQLGDRRIRLEYWSERAGLAPMVLGLLEGLGEMYDVTVSVRQSVDRANGADHDEFMIDYHPTAATASTRTPTIRSLWSPRMSEQRFALSPTLLDAAFPFHLVLDRSLCIIQAGTSIQRLHRDTMVGSPFTGLFDVATPKITQLLRGVRRSTRNRCSCSVR